MGNKKREVKHDKNTQKVNIQLIKLTQSRFSMTSPENPQYPLNTQTTASSRDDCLTWEELNSFFSPADPPHRPPPQLCHRQPSLPLRHPQNDVVFVSPPLLNLSRPCPPHFRTTTRSSSSTRLQNTIVSTSTSSSFSATIKVVNMNLMIKSLGSDTDWVLEGLNWRLHISLSKPSRD